MTDISEVAIPRPGRVGQGTVIEQSRAVAEVYAAVMIARDNPRDLQRAMRLMEQACRTPELAAVAFYNYKRAGSTINDASIHLARELAVCWGNIQHSVKELRRDDEFGQSEMQAIAWDLQTNTRVESVFIQPHYRDRKNAAGKHEPVRLVEMRDIYESNANAGARRVRQCIFGVLPRFYVERAKTLCRETLVDGGGVPLVQRIARVLSLFEQLGVTEQDIARKLDRSSSDWTPMDLADLQVAYTSLQQGTITREEAFPRLVTVEEIQQQATPPPPPAPDRTPAEIRTETTDRMQQAATEEVRTANQAWHADGHPNPDTGRRTAWDPDCPECDPSGRHHYYDHAAKPVEGCQLCQRDAQYREESGS